MTLNFRPTKNANDLTSISVKLTVRIIALEVYGQNGATNCYQEELNQFQSSIKAHLS